MARHQLKDITHADVQRWVSGLSVNGSVRTEGKGLSGSRVIQAHQCLSAVLKYAIRTDRLARNVAMGVELPRKASAEHRYLTHEQLLHLANAIYRGSYGPDCVQWGLITLVMGYCGLRFGEVTALPATDVKDRTITVRASVTKVTRKGYVESGTKTHRTRWVVVPEFMWEDLSELGAGPGTRPTPVRRSAVTAVTSRTSATRQAFDLAAKEIGVPDLVPHGLRHACRRLAIAAGANVLAVQRLLRSGTAAMTLGLYSHLFSDDLTSVAEALNKAAVSAASDSLSGVMLRYHCGISRGFRT